MEQETAFDSDADPTEQVAASYTAQQELLRAHAEHSTSQGEPQTASEETYTLVRYVSVCVCVCVCLCVCVCVSVCACVSVSLCSVYMA